MLSSLAVRGFKSLREVAPIPLAPLTLFFGPNGAGKSNLIDAVLLLSRIVGTRKVGEAFDGPLRGLPLEQFSFPAGKGLPGLFEQDRATFRIEAELRLEKQIRYIAEISIAPASGSLSRSERFLLPDGKALLPSGEGSTKDGGIFKILDTLSSFRAYYVDPRTAMRSGQPPKSVDDIGPLGENLAPFLYRLGAEMPAVFMAVKRTLKSLIPTIQDLVVDLDPRRGVLDVEIRQGGTPFSARLVSEGTLRVLALICAVLILGAAR